MQAFEHLPSELVTHVTVGARERGVAWLHELPATIIRLEALWSLTLGEPFPGIEYNFVAPAVTDDRQDVVVKIHPPWDPIEIFDEAAYLRARGGEGCVQLLAVDEPSRSIMIERLFPGRTLDELFADRKEDAVRPAIELLKRTLMPVLEAPKDVATVDRWFKGFRPYRRYGFPGEYAEKAFRFYKELRKQRGRTYYIHGDFHPGNIVDSDREPFLIIDPKGIVGHLGFEIATFLNNFHWWQESEPNVKEILARAVDQFSIAFEIPEIELRKWAYAQQVIGSWWTFHDMPTLYDGGVVKADIWDV